MTAATSTRSEEQPAPDLYGRCLDVLGQIPDRGLEEALESLIAIRDHHRHPPRTMPKPEPLPTIQAALGEPYIRPEFPISEDDT